MKYTATTGDLKYSFQAVNQSDAKKWVTDNLDIDNSLDWIIETLPYTELFIVKLPFQGYCQSNLYVFDDGTNQVNYKPLGFSFSDYCRDFDGSIDALALVNAEQFDALFLEHESNLKTDPKQITKERFEDMLNVLPPCRWSSNSGFEIFHISERLTGNLVSWFARDGDNHFEFVDDASISTEDLDKKLSLVGA